MKFKVEGENSAGSKINCPECKAELQPGTKFCGGCGHKM